MSYASTGDEVKKKFPHGWGGQIPAKTSRQTSQIKGISASIRPVRPICPFASPFSTIFQLIDSICENQRNLRIEFKEIKSRIRIFKIFIPIFEMSQTQNNAALHKLLKHSTMCKNLLPKGLPQLSRSLRLDGRTIGRDMILTNTTLNYISRIGARAVNLIRGNWRNLRVKTSFQF